MSEDIKIYHVETQEDYDDLMIELEEQGYMWKSECIPTFNRNWNIFKGNTYIALNKKSKRLTYGYMGLVDINYPDVPIIKHKAKGVKQMEKVVVPQCVADWYEKHEKGRSIYGIIGLLNDLSKCDDEKMFMWKMNCEGRNNHKLTNAQEVIAKMHLFQDYEVEEEKKYYWRKKKEYVFDLDPSIYINVTKYGRVFFSDETVDDVEFKTKFTETEVRELVSEEDFNKLERVEIDAN